MECGIWYSEQEDLPRIFNLDVMILDLYSVVEDNENIELLQFQLFDILAECEPLLSSRHNLRAHVKVRVYAEIKDYHIEGMDPQNGGSDCVNHEEYAKHLVNYLRESDEEDIIKEIRNPIKLCGISSHIYEDIEISDPLDIVAEAF